MRKMYKLNVMMLFIAFFFIPTASLLSQISLTASSGTATGTFTTISAAFAAINAGTHTGNIVISVNGNTTEPAAPVYLGASGVSTASYTSLIIKPSVVATISGAPSAGSAVINFNGSDNVTIDGSVTNGGTTKDLTIQNTNAATILNTACIRLLGWTTGGMGVTNMVIKNNIIIGNTPGNNGTSGSTNTTSYGIYAGSNTLTTMSSTTAGANYDNITVENNEVKKAYFGIHFYGGVAPNTNDNLMIKNNTVGSTVLTEQIGFKGINMYQTLTSLIEGNTIFNIKATSSTNPAAIEIGGTASSDNTVSKNRIEAIYSEATGGWGAYGVNLLGGNNHRIINNVITDLHTINYSATSTTYNAFGIRITAGTGHKIYYNSINIFGNLTIGTNQTAASAALCVTVTSVTGLDIKNNIFSNKTTSSVATQEHSAVWFPANYVFQTTTLNNNYYGVPTDAYHFIGKVGITAGTGLYAGLASWQAISQVNNATNDNQSRPITNLPAPFTSNLNLTIPTGTITAIESGAIEISSLGLPNTDFLGATRPGTGGTAPDMGAYEGVYAPITCPQPTTIGISIATTSSATVNWTVGGTETAWQLQHGPVGFVVGSGTTTSASSNPTTISGLTSNSFYQVYVRGICGAGDTSLWTGPILFNTYGQGQYMEADTECPTAGFIDISTTGILQTFTTTSQAFSMQLPFPLLYQGQLQNNISLTNTGAVTFNAVTFFTNSNSAITSSTVNGLYTHWDALQFTGGAVYTQIIGTAPNRQFIVQWNSPLVLNATDKVNVQLVIDEASQEIYYVYDDVNVGNVTFDNGASATIGVAGPNQDIQLSFNSTNYLTNNSCAHFYYTNCPKPINFIISTLAPEDVSFSWTAGLSNESNWTIVYGLTGFNPDSTNQVLGTITSATASSSLSGLTQLTQYDVYIYSDCSPTLQSDAALFGTFTTLPYCSSPAAGVMASDVDSISASWSWTASGVAYPVTGFNLQYGFSGFQLYSSNATEVAANGTNFADTIVDVNLLGGGVYQVYVQAVCGTDTSQFIGPFSVTMPLTNDSVCGAETLLLNGPTYVFNNTGATVQANEINIAPTATGAQTTDGWIASTLNGTTWFKFIAPTSGNMRINCTSTNNAWNTYNGQVAVYENVGGCTDFANFTLNSANDNAIGSNSVAPNYTVCGLTPGTTYYILFDHSGTAGAYSMQLTSIDLEAGTANPVVNVCTGDTVDLFTAITGNQANGVWTAQLATAASGLNGSMFQSAGLAFQTFNFQYRLTDGCAYDSIIGQVKIYPPSSAGSDGIKTVCRNQPFNLLSGLAGNTDMGGQWYNPNNATIATPSIISSNIPGQYNYAYVTGNNVCPNDTANVLVNVLANCDYLAVDELSTTAVTLYPNPTTGNLNVQLNAIETINAIVYDAQGKLILTVNNLKNGSTIDLSTVEIGIYMVHLSTENATMIQRVVKN
jgi:hypothetical protein